MAMFTAQKAISAMEKTPVVLSYILHDMTNERAKQLAPTAKNSFPRRATITSSPPNFPRSIAPSERDRTSTPLPKSGPSLLSIACTLRDGFLLSYRVSA